MELQLIDNAGQSVAVADTAFDREFNESLVHQLVVAYLTGARAGTRAQKTRSDVNGGGAKPWRQKGTGRARAGTIRSPLWRGGGVTFAARPQDHKQKLNRRMYRSGMRSIFSELVRQERLLPVAELSLAEPKTKLMVDKLKQLAVDGRKILLVDVELQENLVLAARNLPQLMLSDVKGISPVALVGAEKVVISKAAIEQIGEWLA